MTVIQTPTIVIAPAKVRLLEGSTQQFTATDHDQFGKNMALTYTWSLPGSTSGATLSATGLYTAPTNVAGGTDTVQASATVNNVTYTGTTTVTYYVPPPTISSVTASLNPVTTTTTTLKVVASSAYSPSLTTSWSVTSMPSGAPTPTFSPNNTSNTSTTVTFFQAGTYTFQVTVTDQFGQATSASVSVTVDQTFSAVGVSPAGTSSAPVQLAHGKQQFTATALDQFGNAMALTPTFIWSLDSGSVGTINSKGQYLSLMAGTAVVRATATVNGVTLSGTANVTVL